MPTYDEALERYTRELFGQEDDILQKIRKQIAERGLPQITVKPEEGRFLQFITATAGVKKALEIGTLGGYSGTWIARGLPPGGHLDTLEREKAHADVAREHFQLAGVEDSVTVHVGDAHELLPGLSQSGRYDLIFIDAEKEGYGAYLEWALDNLAPGGLVAGHNAFSHGAVVDLDDQSERAVELRDFNQKLAEDPRLVSVIFPAGDGIVIGYMRG